ncbi:MAG: class II aldolase/adducin family protein [Eubacteriales bacterium]
MDINKSKDTVILAGKELVKRGLIARTWGNVSQRVDENTMVITPSGKEYLSLKREDIVAVNIHTLEYEGEIKPSSEKGVHAACYKQKDVNFVIHTHQEYASIISSCGIDAIKTDGKYNHLAGKVVCAPYGLPSTKKLSEGIAGVLPNVEGSCIIMKNHGALCFGKDFEQTFEAANQLEEACHEHIKNKYIDIEDKEYSGDYSLGDFIMNKYQMLSKPLIGEKVNMELDENMLLATSAETIALSYIGKPLHPMVDDFAQIVGVKMKAVKNDEAAIRKALKKADAVFVKGCGAVCKGETKDDAKAVQMIVDKNCKCFIGASLHGQAKPINPLECRLMRTVYKMKYSKQKDK